MNIGVVIVTYNRLEKLKKCLFAYEKQALAPAFVLVIDNCSTDGTAGYLEDWARLSAPFQKLIRHMDANNGGAGGFTAGIKEALQMGSDWIWLSDDDAYPAPDCLQCLCDYYSTQPAKEQSGIVSLCGKVVNNHSLSALHRRKIERSVFRLKEVPLAKEDYEAKANEIALFSFVGTMIRTDIILRAGLPHEDYFICYDDTEYALRIGQYGRIICVSDAVIFHDSSENIIVPYSWKNYYMFRNKLYTYFQYYRKWYCMVEYLKHLFMLLRYYNKPASWKQFICATRDALSGRLGKNERYLP